MDSVFDTYRWYFMHLLFETNNVNTLLFVNNLQKMQLQDKY